MHRVGLGCNSKANSLLVGLGPVRGVHRKLRCQTMLCKQAQPGIEPGIFRLPVLSSELLSHFWNRTSLGINPFGKNLFSFNLQ